MRAAPQVLRAPGEEPFEVGSLDGRTKEDMLAMAILASVYGFLPALIMPTLSRVRGLLAGLVHQSGLVAVWVMQGFRAFMPAALVLYVQRSRSA